jgi:hypothetical protein
MKEIKGLIIDTPHIDNILSGKKTWEMRSTQTKQRNVVALIRKGQPGKIIGTVEIIDSIGPLSKEELLANQSKHLMTAERIDSPEASKYRYAWVLKNPKLLKQPISFEQKSGAVIWVNLDSGTSTTVLNAISVSAK